MVWVVSAPSGAEPCWIPWRCHLCGAICAPRRRLNYLVSRGRLPFNRHIGRSPPRHCPRRAALLPQRCKATGCGCFGRGDGKYRNRSTLFSHANEHRGAVPRPVVYVFGTGPSACTAGFGGGCELLVGPSVFCIWARRVGGAAATRRRCHFDLDFGARSCVSSRALTP